MCFRSHQTDVVKTLSRHIFAPASGVLSNRPYLIRQGAKQDRRFAIALKIRHVQVIVIYTHFDIF